MATQYLVIFFASFSKLNHFSWSNEPYMYYMDASDALPAILINHSTLPYYTSPIHSLYVPGLSRTLLLLLASYIYFTLPPPMSFINWYIYNYVELLVCPVGQKRPRLIDLYLYRWWRLYNKCRHYNDGWLMSSLI